MAPSKNHDEEANLLKSIGKTPGKGRNEPNLLDNISGGNIATLPTGIGGFNRK
jgi:hypothetical protein